MNLGLSSLQNKPATLKYVKFQNVRRYVYIIDPYAFAPLFLYRVTVFNGLLLYHFSLTIFIEDNQSGSDVTKIHKIALYGTT
jgi:hypothetical protein